MKTSYKKINSKTKTVTFEFETNINWKPACVWCWVNCPYIVHSLTTVDAPETMQYVKSIPGIIIDKARWADGTHKTMWNLIPHKLLPPTRLMRYCCTELKEQGGKGRLKITGVRAEESRKRAENGGEIKIIGKPKTTEKFMRENNINFLLTNQGGW